MKANYKEPKLTYALDSSGKMVNIASVARGLSCNCRCPKCSEPLVAKLGHEGGRQPHFAHQKGTDCHGSYMTALHKFAEQIIEEEKTIMAPPYMEIGSQKLLFEQVEVEQRVERKDLQPDLVGVTSDGMRWFIEIRNTHDVDEIKKKKIIESNITCLEVDVREQTLENLKTFLLESAENREWINNPIYDFQIAEEKRKKVSQIVSSFEQIDELQIGNDDSIHLKDLEISVSEDGLYATVKASSLNGIPYLFHIGQHKALEGIKPTKQDNELTIDIEKFPIVEDGLSTSYMSWLYTYNPMRMHEASTDDSCDDSRCVVQPEADCYSKCQYRPFHGKCIYQKDIVVQNGINYVVCETGKKKRDRVGSYSETLKSERGDSSTKRLHVAERRDSGEVVSNSASPIEVPPGQLRSIQRQELLEVVSNENLPFERFRTIDDFYGSLYSTSTFKTKNGVPAIILCYEKVGNRIIVLYKDPAEVRTYCPYHISILSASDGDIYQCKVADFVNQVEAKKSYCDRLNGMRNCIPSGCNAQYDEDNLPF